MIGEIADGVFYDPQLNFPEPKRPLALPDVPASEFAGTRDQSISPSRMFSNFMVGPSETPPCPAEFGQKLGCRGHEGPNGRRDRPKSVQRIERHVSRPRKCLR
jgi:hypothetical protein